MSEGQMKKGAATENHAFFIIIPSNRRSQKSFAQPPDRVSPNNVPKSQKLSWKSKKWAKGKVMKSPLPSKKPLNLENNIIVPK